MFLVLCRPVRHSVVPRLISSYWCREEDPGYEAKWRIHGLVLLVPAGYVSL